MYKFKLFKPLSASSIIWALLVTAAVLLVASGVSAQEETSTPPAPAETARTVPAVAPVSIPPAPAAINMTTEASSTPLSMPAAPAEDTPSERAATLEDRLADIQERRAALEAKRTALQSASSSRRALLPETTQQRALNGMAKVASVLSTSINKSRDFTDRLRARADALAADGLVMSNALALMDQAEAHLDLAEQAWRDLDVNAKYAITSDSPRTDWQDVREQFGAVRQAIREAHSLLRAAAAEIRRSSAAPTLPVEINPDQQ